MNYLTETIEEVLIHTLYGAKVHRYRTPVNCSFFRLLHRTMMIRCPQCGRDRRESLKINRDGTQLYNIGCPIHDYNPPQREQDYPINPKH